MTRIAIKRVYEPAAAADGFRVMVDRLWPRGVRKEELHADLWAKDLAPSDDLRRWYHADPEARWPLFRDRYCDQLHNSPKVHEFLRSIAAKPVVTLLYAAKNPVQNHALVLQEFLQHALKGVTVA